MIKATLTRKYTATQTLGELVIGESKFLTIGTLNFIPNGVYNVTIENNPKYNGKHFKVADKCRIYGKTYAEMEDRLTGVVNIDRDILVGMSYENGDLKNAMPAHYLLLMQYPNGFEITIK